MSTTLNRLQEKWLERAREAGASGAYVGLGYSEVPQQLVDMGLAHWRAERRQGHYGPWDDMYLVAGPAAVAAPEGGEP